MKKHLLSLMVAGAIAVVTLWAFTRTARAVFTPAKPVDKNISFAVFKGNSYTSDIYKTTSAEVKITVVKVSGSQRRIVWEKTLDAKQLSEYPSANNALTQTVTFNSMLNKKEHLEVTYTLTYDSRGSQLQMQGETVVTADSNNNKLAISI